MNQIAIHLFVNKMVVFGIRFGFRTIVAMNIWAISMKMNFNFKLNPHKRMTTRTAAVCRARWTIVRITNIAFGFLLLKTQILLVNRNGISHMNNVSPKFLSVIFTLAKRRTAKKQGAIGVLSISKIVSHF